MNGASPEIIGDGNQRRDFIYIDDIATAMLRAAEIQFNGIVNVGSGQSHSFNEIVQIINAELGMNLRPVYFPKPRGYLENTKADTKLMKSVLELTPLSLESGVRKYVEVLRGPDGRDFWSPESTQDH